MSQVIINEYITSHYDRWRQYALCYCYHHGVREDAEDVLSDALYVLLSQDKNKALAMIEQPCDGCTHMDLFFFVVIKYKTMSYAKKQRCRLSLMQSIAQETYSLPSEELMDYEALNDKDLIDVMLSEPNAPRRYREARQRKDHFLSGVVEISNVKL